MVTEGTEKDQAKARPEVGNTHHEATGGKPRNGGWRQQTLGNFSLLFSHLSCVC